MATKSKHVCVVGAGTAGLVAMKECLHEGLLVTGYEIDDGVGGVWYSKEADETTNTPKTWRGLVTNSTKYMSAYSDFPPRQNESPYLTAAALQNYHQRYAEHFNLLEHLHFKTRVVEIRKTADPDQSGKWEVFTCPTKEFRAGDKRAGFKATPEELKRCHREVFDYVLICTGFFKIPKYTEIPGLETFTGTVQHSFSFNGGRQYENKRVLVIGNFVSAGDIAVDISNYTNQVFIASGGGSWIWPRIMSGGRLLDHCLTRNMMYSSNAEVLINDLLIYETQNRLDHVGTAISPSSLPMYGSTMTGDDIYLRVMSNRIKFYGYLKQLDGSEAILADGARIPDIDAIVFCTGYKPDLSFLNMDLVGGDGKMELFKMIFPLNQKHNTLGLIGQCGADSALLQICDAQARYASKVFAGKLALPSQKSMKTDVDFWNQFNLLRRGNYNYTLPGFLFSDGIHQLLGTYPTFWKLMLRDPVLAFRVWYGPLFSAHYRLLGPDSNWEDAREICYRAYSEGVNPLQHKPRNLIHRTDIAESRKRKLLQLAVLVSSVAAAVYFIELRGFFKALSVKVDRIFAK